MNNHSLSEYTPDSNRDSLTEAQRSRICAAIDLLREMARRGRAKKETGDNPAIQPANNNPGPATGAQSHGPATHSTLGDSK